MGKAETFKNRNGSPGFYDEVQRYSACRHNTAWNCAGTNRI